MTHDLAEFIEREKRGSTLSSQTLARVAHLLQQRSGIVLGEHKKETINRHLGAFARRLGLEGIDAYLDYLQERPDDSEWERFVNVFTINHTAFFREAHHFDILATYLRQRNRPLNLWSAAASTGEEAYSMAIVAIENVPHAHSDVRILASDIDTQALQVARRGVYAKERVELLDMMRLRQFFLRGRGPNQGLVRIKPAVRDLIEFKKINLVEQRDWPGVESMDVIFCRNTLIYFSRDTQVKLLERFARVLKPGGLLFVGHSENFSFMNSVLRLKGQTVYERPADSQ